MPVFAQGMPDRPSYDVFISSTYIDNADRRRIVEDAIIRAGMRPVGMERFTASDRPTIAECERLARECDVYVGIVAHRYGWIPEGHDVSITEIEYDAAKGAGRARLMFEVNPQLPTLPEDHDEADGRWTKGQKLDKLDAFKAKYRTDQMSGVFEETTLSGLVVQTLLDWRSAQEGFNGGLAAPVEGYEDEIARYRLAAEAQHANLELAGFKTRLRIPIDLEEVYVPLHAMVDLRAVGDSEFADAADAEKRLRGAEAAHEITLIEAFREAGQRKRRGLVILGDPGSGKTTHLKRLLLWCLRNGSTQLGLEPDVLPVFLPLRNLRDVSLGLHLFIEQELDSPHLGMAPGFGARLLRRGRLLLLFDGLDEVAEAAERTRVAQWIAEAARALPGCIPVVTCRFAGYGGSARLGAGFRELHVRPLTQKQSETFIRNWYRIVETGIASDLTQGEALAHTRAEELVKRLREPGYRTARLLEMTRNPLLLANVCLVHRDRGTLPRGRARLYDECIDVLLELWREGKRLGVGVTADVGRRVLQPAGLWLHEKDERTRATAAELAPVIEPGLKAVHWKRGSAFDFLRTVRDESGLLTGWGQDQYGFMHLGFQEYLAAREIRRLALQGNAGMLAKLADRYGESWWQEVVLIFLALGDPSHFIPFMREVIRRPAFGRTPELLDLILEEAAEVSEEPFVELASLSPGSDPDLWARQLLSLLVLERMGSVRLDEIAGRLAKHPYPQVQRWLSDRKKAINRAVRQERIATANGAVELVRVPSGTFLMGSPSYEQGRWKDEGPQHQVTVRSFYIGRYPVTNTEYASFLEANPDVPEPEHWSDRRFNQARQPVVGVSWEEARRFAAWAGGRLPSEAEWEYAARAGTTAPYLEGGSNADLDRIAWYGSNSGGRTHSVGEKAANLWGLYDVLGNVWEWVEDDWHGDYDGAPADGSSWMKYPRGRSRCVRGGSFGFDRQDVRAACRFNGLAAGRSRIVGFRFAQDL